MADIERSIGFVYDKQGGEQVKRELTSLQRSLDAISRQRALEQVAREATRFYAATGDAAKTAQLLSTKVKEIGQRAQDMQALTKRTKEYEDAAKKAATATGQIAQQQDLVSRFKEDVQGFRREGELQGFALSTIGSVLPGGAAGPAAEIFNLIDTLPKLKTATGIVVKSLTDNITTLGPVGLAAGLALAGVALALGELGKMAEESANAAKAEIDARRSVLQFVQGATKEELEARITTTRETLEFERRELETYQRAVAQGFADAQASVLGDVGARVLFAAQPGAIGEVNAAIAETEKRIQALEAELRISTRALEEGATAAGDNARALEEVTKREEEAARARERVLGVLQGLEEQAIRATEEAERRRSETGEDRRVRDARAEEDYQQQASQRMERHLENLLKIQADGNARIEKLNADLSAIPAERAQALADAEQKANASIATLQSEFFASELKALEKFQAQEKKAQEKANRERLRILNDLNDRLNDAARENNVIAFLQAQREGNKQLEQQSENLSVEARERQEAYIAERRDRAQQFEERNAQLRAQLAQETEQIRKTYEERRTTIAAQIEAEKAAIAERTKAAIDAYAKENAAAQAAYEQRRKRQEEDDARADRRAEEALGRQLAEIDRKAQAELRAVQAVYGATLEIERAAQRIQALAANTGKGPVPFGPQPKPAGFTPSTGPSLGFQPLFTKFATGGVASRPTIGLFGEKPGMAEAFIPFRPSEGLGKALQRYGAGANITINATVGDIASMRQVEEAMRDTVSQVWNELNGVFQEALGA